MLIIETETTTRGSLLSAGRIRLDTWFEGDIVCSRLDIGTDGYVRGNITTRELYVEGQIVGRITAGIVQLKEGAFVEGDIHHHVLSIHPAASLMGRSLRSTNVPFPPELLALEANARNDPPADGNDVPLRSAARPLAVLGARAKPA